VGETPGPKFGVDQNRKLPAYEELKRLYLVEGLSYAEIAARYRVSRSAVINTIRDRAKRRGDWPWPEMNAREKQRRGAMSYRKLATPEEVERIRNWFEVRMELGNDKISWFARRHSLSSVQLSLLQRRRLERATKDWLTKVEAALRVDARASETEKSLRESTAREGGGVMSRLTR